MNSKQRRDEANSIFISTKEIFPVFSCILAALQKKLPSFNNGCSFHMKHDKNHLDLTRKRKETLGRSTETLWRHSIRRILLNANFIFFQSLYDFLSRAFHNFSLFMSMKYFPSPLLRANFLNSSNIKLITKQIFLHKIIPGESLKENYVCQEKNPITIFFSSSCFSH